VTTDDLTVALRACAAGIYALEAGVNLLITNSTFLHRDDFTGRFIEYGTGDGTPMAAIDWHAAISDLATGDLPCSGGEHHHRPPRPARPPRHPRRRHPHRRRHP
jgi:hypothetical protein